MKQTAHIEDWTLVETGNGTTYLVGRVVDHNRQAEFKASLQITSPVVRMPGLGIVETVNTIYTLGRARQDYLNTGVV